MSADNIIYIQKIKCRYWVWEDSASNDNPKPNKKRDISFPKLQLADIYASGLEMGIGYVEYGIRLLVDKK